MYVQSSYALKCTHARTQTNKDVDSLVHANACTLSLGEHRATARASADQALCIVQLC